MNRSPKIVAVGDELLSPDVIKQNLTPLLEEGWSISTCWYGPRDLGLLDEQLAILERYGPDAVQEPEELHDHLKDADVLLVHMCPVSEKLLSQYPNLLAVGVLRGGTENVDSKAAEKLGLPVFHTRGRTSEGVSDYTMGLILSEVRNIARSHAEVIKGNWPKEFSNSGRIPEMRELTVGLIGFGEIGQLVAKKLSGFDTSVQVYDPYVPSDVIEESGAIPTSLERLLETSDVVSLHARHTHGLPPILGKKELEMLKSNAYVINTARAGLLDMDALVDLLKEKKILGAAIDVFENEPIDRNHPILSLPNVTLTSHIAFDTASFYNRSPILWLNGLNEAVRDNNTRTCINFSDHVKVKLEQLKSLWTMKHLTL